MGPVRGVLVGSAIVASATVGAPAMAATSFTVRTEDGFVTSIGTFRTADSLERAVRVFGRPTSMRRVGMAEVCDVRWNRLGLRTSWVTFGAGDPCDVGRLQNARATGNGFRTAAGVRVGSASRTIRTKHPGARFVRGTWWIATARFPAGDGEPSPTVQATVRGGRVTGLSLFVGAAGD